MQLRCHFFIFLTNCLFYGIIYILRNGSDNMIGMCNSWTICPLVGHCVFKNDHGEEAPDFGEKFCELGKNLFVKKDAQVIKSFTECAKKIAEERK